MTVAETDTSLGDAFLTQAEREFAVKLRSTLVGLRSLGLATPLQLEVVEKLLDGRRTLPELVELIYQAGTEEEDYKSYYMRVRRAMTTLQARGLVSTKLFGKNKPYRLTRYAVETITTIASEPTPYRLVPTKDAMTYTLAMSVSIVTLLLSKTTILGPPLFLSLGGASCFLIGVAFCRFVEAMKKVV